MVTITRTLFVVVTTALAAAAVVVLCAAAAPPSLTVHVIPHSHDDVGWLVTPTEYYENKVRYIIETYLDSLLANPERRFIQVETYFLQRWWRDATESRRAQYRQIVARGQVEFVIGGFVMADEACANYVSRINQLEQGHQFLLENFGPEARPTKGWQIDPFGASLGTPVLFNWTCFDGLVIDRVPFELKNQWERNQSMEFWWHPNQNNPNQRVFTHLMDSDGYCSPGPYDYFYSGNLLNPDDPPVTPMSAANITRNFIQASRKRAAQYKSSHLMWPAGCDFQYADAEYQFTNWDYIVNYAQEHAEELGATVQYSTLSDYFDAVRGAVPDSEWPRYSEDFYCYNDEPYAYWSGYFTSRPHAKGVIRQADTLIRDAESMFVLGSVLGADPGQQPSCGFGQPQAADAYIPLRNLRNASAITMHHDAVTGTSKAFVMLNYIRLLDDASPPAASVLGQYAQRALQIPGQSALPGGSPTLTPNGTWFYDALQSGVHGNTGVVVVYNSLAWTRVSEPFSVWVPSVHWTVVEADTGNPVAVQARTDPRWGAEAELNWIVDRIGPMSMKTYLIVPSKASAEEIRAAMPVRHPSPSTSSSASASISNPFYELSFGPDHNLAAISLQGSTTTAANGTTKMPVQQSLFQYHSSTNVSQPSGTYIFRSEDGLPAFPLTKGPELVSWDGPLFQMVNQSWSWNMTQSMRVWNVSRVEVGARIELVHNVGPLDGNRELITRWQTDFPTGGQFTTVDSGFLAIDRQYNPSLTLPIAGNFFPMPSDAYIRDPQRGLQLSIIGRRAHGVSSQFPGELEVMIHRRVMQDDRRGVGEPLNDTDSISVHQWAMLQPIPVSEQYRVQLAQRLNFPLRALYTTVPSGNQWLSHYRPGFTPVQDGVLPPQLHLLHFQVYNGTAGTQTNPPIVIRLQHVYEAGRDPVMGKPATVDLAKLLGPTMRVQSVQERVLSANIAVDQCPGGISMEPTSGTTVTLQPGEIRTWFITLAC